MPRIRHSTGAAAHPSQLPLATPNRPHEPPQSQPAEPYSSTAPKMWQDSWANTRSMLSGPQPSFS
ncbi:hypothetical protein I6A84_42490 [Frankia sp. CNm7]|nr:hypothetical protein [Frankia nepalensis]MBL7524534.1 hypothetical protein [Frankia nepalensis]